MFVTFWNVSTALNRTYPISPKSSCKHRVTRSHRSDKGSGRSSESPLWCHQWLSFFFISHADDIKHGIRLYIYRLLTNQKRESAWDKSFHWLHDMITPGTRSSHIDSIFHSFCLFSTDVPIDYTMDCAIWRDLRCPIRLISILVTDIFKATRVWCALLFSILSICIYNVVRVRVTTGRPVRKTKFRISIILTVDPFALMIIFMAIDVPSLIWNS